MNKKIILLIGMLTLLSAFVLADFTTTLQSPAASGTVKGTAYALNASFDANLNGTSVYCEFYARSSLTANSSNVLLVNQSNTTAYATDINATFNSANLEDADNYIFNASCYNNSNRATDTSTLVIVDNTVPIAPTSVLPANRAIDTDCSITFSATVTGNYTTLCSIRFDGRNPGASFYEITESGGTCSRTLTVAESTYTWFMRATDGTNVSDSATTQVSCDKPDKGGAAAAAAMQAQQKQNLGIAVSEDAKTSDPQKTKETVKAVGGAIAGGFVGFYVLPMVGIVGGPVGMMIGGIAGFILGSIA